MLLPFQGAINVTTVPGALPRAVRSLGFQPADSNGGVSLLISDEPILCVVFTDIYKTCCWTKWKKVPTFMEGAGSFLPFLLKIISVLKVFKVFKAIKDNNANLLPYSLYSSLPFLLP